MELYISYHPDIGNLLNPIEDTLWIKLFPSMTGSPPPNDAERDLLAMPVRLGGIGMSNLSKRASEEFAGSLRITGPLKSLITKKNPDYLFEALEEQMDAKANLHKLRLSQQQESASLLKPSLNNSLQRAMELAQEKGASSWLAALPVAEFGFTLHKSAFRDALCLRYGWQPSRVPLNCDCGSQFSVEHALSCPKGGFPIRHNEMRDLTANLLSEVCNDVCIEPHLQPITGEHLSGASANTQDGARLDIAANRLWGGRNERTFFDVRVFKGHTLSRTDTPILQHAITSMRRRRRGPTSKESLKLNPFLLPFW